MKHQRHYGMASKIALREATVIKTMIDDLNRTVCLLDYDITSAEERARISVTA
jgi:hypothetical protein